MMTSYVQQPIGQGPEHDMLRDRYGLEVSTSSDEAHGHYLVAMDRILAAVQAVAGADWPRGAAGSTPP